MVGCHVPIDILLVSAVTQGPLPAMAACSGAALRTQGRSHPRGGRRTPLGGGRARAREATRVAT